MRAATVWLRSFLLEAVFNPRGMQRCGFRWMAGWHAPIDPRPFNANPTLAPYCAGVALRHAGGAGPDPAGPIAAAVSGVGDRLIWGILRPLAVATSLLAALVGPVPAAAALLLVYNPPELALRARAAAAGLRGADAVLQDLSQRRLRRLVAALGRIAGVAAGAALGAWAVEGWTRGVAPAGVLGLAVAALLAAAGRKRRLGAGVASLAAVGLGLVWAWFRTAP